MTDRPADARAFSRPAPKAREKRPGDEVAFVIELFRIDLKIQLSELLSRDCNVFQFQKYSRV